MKKLKMGYRERYPWTKIAGVMYRVLDEKSGKFVMRFTWGDPFWWIYGDRE